MEKFDTRREAANREREIKTLSHEQKLELINNATKQAILSAI
jgi:predicted GIY-YIG superfamily endonuclease